MYSIGHQWRSNVRGNWISDKNNETFVLAGMPIMKSNDIGTCPFKHQVTIDEKVGNILSASDKQKLSTYSKCLTLYSIQVLKDVMFIWVS